MALENSLLFFLKKFFEIQCESFPEKNVNLFKCRFFANLIVLKLIGLIAANLSSLIIRLSFIKTRYNCLVTQYGKEYMTRNKINHCDMSISSTYKVLSHIYWMQIEYLHINVVDLKISISLKWRILTHHKCPKTQCPMNFAGHKIYSLSNSSLPSSIWINKLESSLNCISDNITRSIKVYNQISPKLLPELIDS